MKKNKATATKLKAAEAELAAAQAGGAELEAALGAARSEREGLARDLAAWEARGEEAA